MSEAKHTPWEQLTSNALDTMKVLGNFGPTSCHKAREVKGYMACGYGEDGGVYFDSNDLRRISEACKEVADWLDARAAIEEATK